MASPTFRPRSSSELVDAAFQILRAHYAQFVMCSALAYLPWLAVQLIVMSDPGVADIGSVASVVVAMGIFWLTFAVMSAVIIVCASQAYLGDPVDVGSAVRTVLPRLAGVLGGALVRYLCILVGALLFLVGAAYAAVRLFAVTPAIVLEREGVPGALSRSTRLSRGRAWHIFKTLGLVTLIYWVLAIGVVLAGSLLGSELAQVVLPSIFTVLVYPVIAITEALVYYDARIRGEGLDIELMAGALEAHPARPAS